MDIGCTETGEGVQNSGKNIYYSKTIYTLQYNNSNSNINSNSDDITYSFVIEEERSKE
jgi:hypothetical protein